MMPKFRAGVFCVSIFGSSVLLGADLADVETVEFGHEAQLSQPAEIGPNQLQAWFTKVNELQSEVQMLRGLVEEQNYLIERLTQKQTTLYLDIDKRLNALSKEELTQSDLNGMRSDNATIKQLHTMSEDELYSHAYQFIASRHFDSAQQAFDVFLKQFPDSVYQPNVWYWLGEINLAEKEYHQAIANFKKVYEQFPLNPKASDALLKLGFVAYEQADYQSAIDYFTQVLSQFPDSSAARLAQAKLKLSQQAKEN